MEQSNLPTNTIATVQDEEEKEAGKHVARLPFALDDLKTDDNLLGHLKNLIEQFESSGNDGEWSTIFFADDLAFVDKLINLLLEIDIQHEAFDSLLFTLYAVCSLDPMLFRFIGSQYGIIEKLANSIDSDQEEETLLTRLHFLHKMLECCPSHEVPPIDDIKSVISSIADVLQTRSESVFDIAVHDLLLIDALNPDGMIVFKYARGRRYSHQFSHAIINLINRSNDEKLLRIALGFVERIFTTGSSEFFFTNDIFVLIDILIRNLDNCSFGEQDFMDVLSCFWCVYQWNENMNQHKYKLSDVLGMFARLKKTHGQDDTIREVIETMHSALARLQM